MTDAPENARVGAAGKGYVAPLGTTVPVGIETQGGTSPNFTYTPIPWSDFFDLGLISDDGLTESLDEDRQSWTPWGYLAPVRTQITNETTTFKITCWETNAMVLSLRYRTALTDMDEVGREIRFNQTRSTNQDLRVFGFDVLDGDSMFRYVVPRGEVTERADVVYKEDEIVAYEFTITAYPGSDGVSIARYVKAGIDLEPEPIA